MISMIKEFFKKIISFFRSEKAVITFTKKRGGYYMVITVGDACKETPMKEIADSDFKIEL